MLIRVSSTSKKENARENSDGREVTHFSSGLAREWLSLILFSRRSKGVEETGFR